MYKYMDLWVNRLNKVIKMIAVFALLAVYPTVNFLSVVNEDYSLKADTNEGVSYLQNLSSADVSEAEILVYQAEESRIFASMTPAEIAAKNIELLEKGKTTYKKVLKNVYIAGDSLMNGLESYGVLSKKRLFTQISATLYHLEDNMKKIVKKKPGTLILHYGINMLGNDDESLNGYIEMYTKSIKKLKKKLPETRIIVSSIFPVDRKVAKRKELGRIKKYNKALKKMCKDLEVDYLNNSPLFKEIEYMYGRDGIHLPEAFYRDHWLKYVIKEMEIV